MHSVHERESRRAGPPPAAKDNWHRRQVGSSAEAAPFYEMVAAEMGILGYSTRDTVSVRLAVAEAVTNAVRHGHRGDPNKRVQVGFLLTREQVLVEIVDQGPGFDPNRLPDPRAPENLEREGGRGVFLMRTWMTWVRFSGAGNHVTMCKYRSTP
jgi:serine/threonine-protein kinase RsbW